MDNMLLMGVDIGTSSAKAIIMTTTGNLVAEAQHSYKIQEPQPGYRIQNPDEVLDAVLATMKNAISQLDNVNLLKGIGFSCAMHSLMAVDENGKPLTELMLWADTRSQPQATFIKKNLQAKDLYETCGVPIHPMTPLCKIMWLKENQPEVHKKAFKFISIKEYLFYRLTGKYLVDISIASATGMFNIQKLKWHEPALKLAGIDAGKLSLPVPIFESFITMPTDLLRWFGLTNQVELIIGSSDGCLANIGSGVTKNGGIAVTISTSMAVRITTASPYYDEAESLFNYAIEHNKFACGGGSNNGSLLLHWMADSMLQNKSLQNPEAFMKKALTAPAGCEGLLFLPYLLGERAPVWDATATGVIHGLQFQHRQQHIMRSLIEGLTMNAFIIIERLLPVAGTKKIIKASGGFTNSSDWVQMLADVSNLPVMIDNKADASAMGAVMVAGYSLGIFKSIETSLDKNEEKTTFYPNETTHLVYKKNYDIFKKLYNRNY